MTRRKTYANGNRRHGFTILQVVAVAVGLVLAIAIVIPMFYSPRINSRAMQNSTQLRGIHQGFAIFCQSNKFYYPGIGSAGHVIEPTVEGRLDLFMAGDFVTPEYLISPGETAPMTELAYDLSTRAYDPVTAANYSYAMLQIDTLGRRQNEWRETANTMAMVLSDRDTAGNPAKPESVWGKTPWRGSVLWNNNHAEFSRSHVMPTAYDRPSQHVDGKPVPATNLADNLFALAGPDDAFLIHSGK